MHFYVHFLGPKLSVFQTKNGKWRVQVRRKSGHVDELYDTQLEAETRQRFLDGGPQGISFSSFVERHYLQSRNYKVIISENSRLAYADRLVHLNRFFANHALSSIDVPSATQYLNSRDAGSSTIAGELAMLSIVLSYAVELGFLEINRVRDSLKRLKGPPVRRERRFLAEEMERLSIAAGPYVSELDLRYKSGRPRVLTPSDLEAVRFFIVLAHLGCRGGELSDLTFDNLQIPQCRYITRLKGGHLAIRPLAQTCMFEILEQQSYADSRGYSRLFQTIDGPYRFKNAAARLRDIGILADDFYPHALRREFISSALELGASSDTIILATGHTRSSSLAMYDRSSAAAPERVALLHELFKQQSVKRHDERHRSVTLIEHDD